MSDIDPEKIVELMKEATQRFILPRFQALQDHEVSTKTGPSDMVTAADIEAEAFLTEALPKILPNSRVLGEEGVSADPAIMEYLEDKQADIWIVDPVDGTSNFVKGNERFGMMVALVRGGECVMSWIYHIPLDEMVVSSLGGGAYSNGVRLSVEANGQEFVDLEGFLGTKYFPFKYREAITALKTQYGNMQSAGCAAFEYLQIAKGVKDFAVYRRLKPWDHVPGTLMVSEAGGYVRKWDGKPLAAEADQIGITAARDVQAWNEVYVSLLQPALGLPDLA